MIYIYDTIPFIQKKLIGEYKDGFIADKVVYRLWDSDFLVKSFLTCNSKIYCIVNEQYRNLLNESICPIVNNNIYHGTQVVLEYNFNQVEECKELCSVITSKQMRTINQYFEKNIKSDDIVVFNTKDMLVDKQDLLWISCMLKKLNAIKIGYIQKEYDFMIEMSNFNVLIFDDTKTLESNFDKYKNVNIIIGMLSPSEAIIKIKDKKYKVFSTFHQDDRIIIESVIASIADSLELNTNVYSMIENIIAYSVVSTSTNAENISVDAINKIKEKIKVEEIGG